jgi:alanine racemase
MSPTRRAFLKASAALPALGFELQPGQTPSISTHLSSFDPWVEVSEGHLRSNATSVSRLVKRPIMAVIKNNGYGAGVEVVARALEPLDAIAGFAVVKLHEAMTLRDRGIRKPILLMGPVREGAYRDLQRRRIALMLYTPISRALEQAWGDNPMGVHVCVDTGLGRVGVPHHRAAGLMRELANSRVARIAGTMMTFTEDVDFDREQLTRFRTLLATLDSERVPHGPAHAASSYTLFQHQDAFLDMVRPGMALYGIYPEPAFQKAGLLDLKPALALKARVAYVKQLQTGESAGYNRAYRATRPVWVATLPVGHADGLPRTAAKGGRVRIGERLYPIIASVSASHTIVEIGDEQRVKIGDEATLFDWTDGSRPEDLAAACGASVYDLLMHLNPLLERMVITTRA